MQGIHVRRGDTVGVIAGRERGKRGKVLHVLTDKGRVLVEHVNMSNVLPFCARCDKPARTGVTVLADGRKVRTCKRCGEPMDKG